MTRADPKSKMHDAHNKVVDVLKGRGGDPVILRWDGSAYGLDVDNPAGSHANFGGGNFVVTDTTASVGNVPLDVLAGQEARFWNPGGTNSANLKHSGTNDILHTDDGLTIAGLATVGGTLGVTGATTLSSTLGVTGATTLSSTLNVTGAAVLSSTLAVTGDFTVNTNKFNVTAASGNTSVLGDFAVNTSKFTVAAATGNTLVAGTLTVTGAAILSSTLSVADRITASKGILIDGTPTTPAAGDIYSVAAHGLIIRPKAGSTNDLLITNSAASTIMSNPTTTINVAFPGIVSIGSSGVGGLAIAGGASAQGTLYSNANNGSAWTLKTGLVRDLLISGPAGATILEIPFGTTDITIAGRMQIGAPTGGFQGAGTINAKGLYDDGVLTTDHLWDLWYDGAMLPEDAERYPVARLYSIAETEAFTRDHHHMPTLPSRSEWASERRSVGEMVTHLWGTVEMLQQHIYDLHARMEALRVRHR